MGGIVALVCAGGAGKSTFPSVVPRLLAADAGCDHGGASALNLPRIGSGHRIRTRNAQVGCASSTHA